MMAESIQACLFSSRALRITAVICWSLGCGLLISFILLLSFIFDAIARKKFIFLRKERVLLNLPRHESDTLLRAIQTAKNLFAQSIGLVGRIDDLKNLTFAVNYYIIILNHINNIAYKP